MKQAIVLLAAVLLISNANGARKLYSEGVHDLFSSVRSEEAFSGEVWALLIAGSAGWGNYRSALYRITTVPHARD